MYNQCFGKSTLREVQNFETKRMYNENGGVYFILVIAQTYKYFFALKCYFLKLERRRYTESLLNHTRKNISEQENLDDDLVANPKFLIIIENWCFEVKLRK